MTQQDARTILEKLADFLNKNDGNTLNEWLSIPLINTLKMDLEKIIVKDQKQLKELENPDPTFGIVKPTDSSKDKPAPPHIVSRKEGEQPSRPTPPEGSESNV